jgi:hypothetical protein
MRTSLAQELALKNEKANQNELNKKLMESIINENDFQVPNIIVANEAYRQAKMYMQGKEPDEQMIKILSQIVTPQVKEIYIYEALRKEYALEITEEQVNTLVESLAGLEELTVEEFKEEHKDLFEDDRIKDEAMFEQIFADLAKRVKIVDPEVFAQEKEAKLKAKKEAKDAAEKAKKAEKTEE